jgi:opacity protein-like surface antigen
MMLKRTCIALALALVGAVAAFAADVAGKWTAVFDTQIGQQNYTYQFNVTGSTVTGTAESANGKTDIQDGKVNGDTVTFVEMLNVQGMTIRVEYTGKIAGDEIKFIRKVGDFATEDLVAKRAK